MDKTELLVSNRVAYLSPGQEVSKNVLKIVIANDDGIDAPGLAALVRCARRLGDVVIVAPQHPQSGIAHRVTTREPILINELEANRHSIDGTPADCARIALKVIAPDAGWLISGINPGANLGSDVYNSGTVAAAREAAILGYRAIAVSQYIEFCELDTHPHNYAYHQNGNELTYKGTIHARPRDAGKDVAVCFDEGRIAITRLAVGTGEL